MVNAGRVLIIPKGAWSNLTPYEMLDLVSEGDKAYLARQASVGMRPSEDISMTYWQPFGSSASIATTDTPGLVMPDGVTIKVDETGLIVVNLNVSDLKDIKLTNLANGDILKYDGTQSKWVNVALGTAATRNATSSITSGSTDLIESGAVNSLKQTLETQISDKLGSSDIANNLTTTTTGKVLDANQGKVLNDSKADKSDLASISITGTTNNTGSTIPKGTFFYKSGTLVRAKADIANEATLTTNTNYEVITAGALNALGQPKELTITGALNAVRVGDLVIVTFETNLTNANHGYALLSGLPDPYQQVFASFVTNTNKDVPCYLSSGTNGQLLIWYPDAAITGRVDGQLVYLAKN